MNWESVLRGGSDLGRRINIVGIIPTIFLVVFVFALLLSGPPGHAPSWSRLVSSTRELSAVEAFLVVAVILLIALLVQPFQRPLVRMMEGYWAESCRCPAWLSLMARHHQTRRYDKLSNLASPSCDGDDPPRGLDGLYVSHAKEPDLLLAEWRAFDEFRHSTAMVQLVSRFPQKERILPTALGNVLRAAEDSAGQRYGLDTVTLWPALYSVLSPAVRDVVDDQRDQMDVAARLSAVLLLCALASAGLLWSYPYWMLGFVAAALIGAYLAYRAAVTAAEGYGVMLKLAFDRHRFDLLTGLHLPQPSDSAAEFTVNQQLTAYLRDNAEVLFHYQHQGPDSVAQDEPGPRMCAREHSAEAKSSASSQRQSSPRSRTTR